MKEWLREFLQQNRDDERRNQVRLGRKREQKELRTGIKIIHLPSLEFSELCLEVEAKIATCSSVVLNKQGKYLRQLDYKQRKVKEHKGR